MRATGFVVDSAYNQRMGKSARDESTLNIEQFLREQGFDTAAAMRAARLTLEAAGLTHGGKQGIAAYKAGAAKKALASKLARVCGDACASLADADRRVRRVSVVSSGSTCEVCGGSNNRRAAITLARVLQKKKVSRVLVVGGTVAQQRELAELLAFDGLQLEFVDGTARSHSQRDAIANMNRAELLVIWGPTPLRHAVSNLYTAEPPSHLRVINVPRRGIEALCSEVLRSYS